MEKANYPAQSLAIAVVQLTALPAVAPVLVLLNQQWIY